MFKGSFHEDFEKENVMAKIKVGDYVFCKGEGMAIFPVESVFDTSAFLAPNVREGDIGSGGNESLCSLTRVQDSKWASDFPEFCVNKEKK